MSRMQRIRKKIRTRFWDLEDALYEKYFRLQFGPSLSRNEIATDCADSLLHANGYQAVRYRKMKILLREARKTGIHFVNFIDIGAGTGKACCVASGEAQFEKIIGIDFSRPLLEVAERNRLSLGDPRVQFYYMDALSFTFPAQNNLIFMFNPFDGVLLERVINNNKEHFRRHESVIAYANDTSGGLLVASGFQATYVDQQLRLALYRFL